MAQAQSFRKQHFVCLVLVSISISIQRSCCQATVTTTRDHHHVATGPATTTRYKPPQPCNERNSQVDDRALPTPKHGGGTATRTTVPTTAARLRLRLRSRSRPEQAENGMARPLVETPPLASPGQTRPHTPPPRLLLPLPLPLPPRATHLPLPTRRSPTSPKPLSRDPSSSAWARAYGLPPR